ncbi:DEAD/DEAH box helicase [Sansalvadorimonas verongulae]|uniref:DEAD/DEAH box helicase n=1 Tax=Sansalvadorimonas verongulae TaxID=2172824 RepID=UPI0012BD1655|nr:DEAD/DEAH box helicase [Sansalvadorimonas verongulae]MTI15552.1 DEAD/DEAH box helicase [Sansalvadorimonas verongulae]
MSLLQKHLELVDQHWAVQAVGEEDLKKGFEQAGQYFVESSLQNILKPVNSANIKHELFERLAMAYELAAYEGLDANINPSPRQKENQLYGQAGAHRAFTFKRLVTVYQETDEARVFHILHLAGLAYGGDRWTDMKRWLAENETVARVADVEGKPWDQKLLHTLYEAWLKLLRKDGWSDLDSISQLILSLRENQKVFEQEYLRSSAGKEAKVLRLVALYHWAKATELLASFMLQGQPASINTELDQHFEASCKAVQGGVDHQFEMIIRWLHLASKQMVAGSVWWVAHNINSRVTRFVNQATKHRAMFELLPPQRTAIQEQGLLNPAGRAVVVDMPTSGGKTALAVFRMLQALNQFSDAGGWIAYVAPTRALVSQITRRLREDFSPLGINVEPLTGAVEVDSFEEDMLEADRAFDVLVATPEKLQLVLRNKKVNRPLALVVMDEAHNIEDEYRGLRIELLLATIKQEYETANFLLLMPFVPNSEDLAHWLGDGRGTAISLSTAAWQPNERIIGIFDAKEYKGKGAKRGDWKLEYETLTTTHNSIHLKGAHQVGDIRPIKRLTASQVKNGSGLSAQAGAMAKAFSARGTSIAVAQKIPDVWSLARKLCEDMPVLQDIHEDIQLVQRFLETEVSSDFELIGMLSKGVAVHHAGLPAEVLALIEWLTEKERIKVLCATTTIAQGLNFPISSVFMATYKHPYGIKMSPRAFWNIAGRAGRVDHGSVGVVGIAAGKEPNEVRKFVSEATGDLVSRLVGILEDMEQAGEELNLSDFRFQDQWADFRSYVAHLWNEKKELDAVINQAEQLLRGTYGYSSLRSKGDEASRKKADAVLRVTKEYVHELAESPAYATLADATGFSPEGVKTAFNELSKLENKLDVKDWQADSLFGEGKASALPDLVGIMMKLPQLKKLEEISGKGPKTTNLADITQAWVSGKSLEDIATEYFQGKTSTDQISNACKAVYRDLANNGAWGLSALSKMPTSGLDYENMSDEDKRQINNLPAMIYHGVRSEEAVLMRMNSVPRSVAEGLGDQFKQAGKGRSLSPAHAGEFLRSLTDSDWERVKPNNSALSGADYQAIWRRLSGNTE